MRDELAVLGPRALLARLPEVFVPRPRLDARLADGARRRVTLVSAPPGAGKTTLIAAALGARGGVAAVTLDARDNETGRLAGLVAAGLIQRRMIDAGTVPAAATGLALLDAVFGRLERVADQVVLVLDDVHALASPDALATLDYLVARAPPHLHVVIAGRADPPIRLTRLRLDGSLGEIRHDSLAFDPTEARELLAAHKVRLTRSQAHALWRRTEGWAAGLRLAAVALQGHPDPRQLVQGAAVSESLIVDYLLEELLTRRGQGDQQFLLQTSVTQRMTPELAEVLTDDPRAGDHLAHFERNGVLRTDTGECRWYHYHPLFGTLLHARLRLHHPGLADDLHRRAAAWFLDHDMPREAESHARQAQDWDLLGGLTSHRWVEQTLAGTDSSRDLLTGVPPAALARSEGLALVAVADACSRLDRAAADTLRDTVDGLAATAASEGTLRARPAGDGAAPEARALLDITYARAFGADARARAALASLGSCGSATGASDDRARLADLRSIGLDLDEGEIERAGRRAAALALSAASTWVGAEALTLLALTEALRGAPDLAGQHADRARAVAATGSAAAGIAPLVLAVCHALRGERHQALDALAEATTADTLDAWLRVVDAVVRTALQTQGRSVVGLDVDGAIHPLARRALVTLGVLEVVDTAGRAHPTGGPAENRVLRARQRWDRGDAPGVLSALGLGNGTGSGTGTGSGQPPADGGHPRTTIEAHALVALASARLGDDPATGRALGQAFDGLVASGIWDPLLALGPSLASLLDDHAAGLGAHHRLALELVERARPPRAPAFVEPLTNQETAVLRLLPALMTYNDIAASLRISVNTVKTHLKSLYRKFGVASRREAVQRGRALGLLQAGAVIGDSRHARS